MKRLQECIDDIGHAQMTLDDYTNMIELSNNLVSMYSRERVKCIYERLIKMVPTEIWTRIFSFLKVDIEQLIHLRTVSKTFYVSISGVTTMHIGKIIPERQANQFAKFPLIRSLTMHCNQSIDYSLLHKIEKLVLLNGGTHSALYINFKPLTSLTSLSICGYITNDVLKLVPDAIKLQIRTLKIGNWPVGIKLVNQFTNLTKLVLSNVDNGDTNLSLLKLQTLRLDAVTLKKIKNFTGTAQVKLQHGIYVGSVSNGEINGKGRLVTNSGNVYSGEFVNGHAKGVGVMEYASGCIYRGQWNNSERHGRGVAIHPNGITQDGIWNEDNFYFDLQADKFTPTPTQYIS